MTAADVDPVRAFRGALPAHLNSFTMTARVVALIHRATRDQGWTIPQLVAECTRDTAGTYRPGGLITHRLEACADRPFAPSVTGLRRAHFGCCQDGWLYDETGDVVRATKCPGNRQEDAS